MKKYILFSGIVTLNLFLFGGIFKVMHWPYANLLVTLGLGLFAMAFLPPAVYSAWESGGRRQTPLYLAGFVSLFVCVTGALFKICHYPGGHVLLLVATPLPFVLFLPVFLYYHLKDGSIPLKSFLGVMFLLLYLAVFSALLAMGR